MTGKLRDENRRGTIGRDGADGLDGQVSRRFDATYPLSEEEV
jgi:hypothetical protein